MRDWRGGRVGGEREQDKQNIITALLSPPSSPGPGFTVQSVSSGETSELLTENKGGPWKMADDGAMLFTSQLIINQKK